MSLKADLSKFKPRKEQKEALSFIDSEFNTSWELKTLFMQEIFQESVFVATTHNVSLAMDEEVQYLVRSSYRIALEKVAKSISRNSVKDDLKVQPLKPLFKVR